jgi:hypothetical protein
MRNVYIFLDQRKQAKMQWLHHLNQSNGDNPINVRCVVRKNFRKKRKIRKANIEELETYGMIKNIRDL